MAEIKIAPELRHLLDNVANTCGLKTIERKSPLREKKNALMLKEEGGKSGKIGLLEYDENSKPKILARGAVSTIEKALDSIQSGCEIKQDSFKKKCSMLGGKTVYQRWAKKPLCRFLDPEDRPTSMKTYLRDDFLYPPQFRLTTKEEKYLQNTRNIIRVDYQQGYLGNEVGFLAWVYDLTKGGDGEFVPIEIDDVTFKEWINQKDATIESDREWREGLSEDKKMELERYEDELIAERGFIKDSGDSFGLLMGSRNDIISFVPTQWSGTHDWKSAFPMPEGTQLAINKGYELEKNLKNEDRNNEAEIIRELITKLDEAYPWAVTSGYYRIRDRFLDKYMRESPLDEWNEIGEEYKKIKEKSSYIGEESQRREYEDNLNWRLYDKKMEELKEIGNKLDSNIHRTIEAPKYKEMLKDIRLIVNLFDDEIYGEDD